MWYLKVGNEALPLIASQKQSASVTMAASGKTKNSIELLVCVAQSCARTRPLFSLVRVLGRQSFN